MRWPGALTEPKRQPSTAAAVVPIVTAHGMGDSCFNAGMKQITSDAAAHVGAYGVCVPTGDNVVSDTIDGFLMNMDKSVDVFAGKIKADPKLANGFNCVGFSQGNSLCRGYIHKYSGTNGYPQAFSHLSVHGTVMGVSGFPQCNPDGGGLCKDIAELCGDLAYNSLVQGILFQADYFRDPTKRTSAAYLKNSQLAAWNNEDPTNQNDQYKQNFIKTGKFVMVKAAGDTMVFPNAGEWWGEFALGSYTETLPMNQTELYKNDLFGLKTVDEAGGIHFEETQGNHLQFTEKQLFGWLDKYLYTA